MAVEFGLLLALALAARVARVPLRPSRVLFGAALATVVAVLCAGEGSAPPTGGGNVEPGLASLFSAARFFGIASIAAWWSDGLLDRPNDKQR